MRSGRKAGFIGFLFLVVVVPSAAGLPPYDILIVNDGHIAEEKGVEIGSELDRKYAERYKKPIAESVKNADIDFYNTTPAGYGPSQETMDSYDLVVWYTLGDLQEIQGSCPSVEGSRNNVRCTTLFGDTSQPFTGGGDVENITRYLREDNGRLFIVGQRLHRSIKNSKFQQEVLYSNRTADEDLYECDRGNCNSVSKNDMAAFLQGESYGPVITGSNYFIRINNSIQPREAREVLYELIEEPDERESPVRENLYFYNPFGGDYWIDVDSDQFIDPDEDELAHSLIRASNESFKFVTMGFGPEAIIGERNRRTLFRRTVNFLLGPRADRNSYLDNQVFDQPAKARVGETGAFRNESGTWVNVSFDAAYQTPVVIGDVNSDHSDEAPIVEVRNVHPTWAEVRFCESEGDGTTNSCDTGTEEVVGYLVIDAAKVDRVKGIEAGRIDVDGGYPTDSKSITFDESFSSDPVVLGTVQTVHGNYPIETRVNTTSDGFAVGLCHATADGACQADHAEETVGWVAFQPGLFDPSLDSIPTMNTTPLYQRGSGGAVETRSSVWESVTMDEQLASFDFDDEFDRNGLKIGGNWTKETNDGSAQITTDCTTSKALHLWGGDSTNVTTKSFDLSNRDFVRVTYSIIKGYDRWGTDCDPPESGDEFGGENGDEDLVVEYYDGGAWNTLKVHDTDDYGVGERKNFTHDLSADALHSDFKMRIRHPNATLSDGDYWAVDDVEIGNASVSFGEVQSSSGGGVISTRSITGGDEGRIRFCEVSGSNSCSTDRAGTTLGWMAFERGALYGDLRDNPSYTNDQVDVAGLCRNYQQVFGTGIRSARFFVEGDTGVPSNHRNTSESGYGLTAFDGSFGESREHVIRNGYNASGNHSPKKTNALGINVSVAIQCQDNQNSFNYWGPFAEEWLAVDTEPPYDPESLSFGDSNLEFAATYTDTAATNITVLSGGAKSKWLPDLVRFSCQSNGPWTGWRRYDRSQSQQDYTIDLTDRLMACEDRDRNVTVYAQIRDLANNTAESIASDWIVLDRENPRVASIEPTNNILNQTDALRVNASDNKGTSVGLDAPNNTFFNGTHNTTFLPNASFEAGYSLEQAPSNLTYTWYDTQEYYDDNGHPTTKAEFDAFFDASRDGVTLGGTGRHERRVYWHTGQWDEKPSYLPSDGYSWKVEGHIYAPVNGTYTFAVDSDDASDVWIDGEQVVAWITDHAIEEGWSHNATVELTEGWHSFRARMEEGDGADGIGVAWKRPTDKVFSPVPYEYFATSRNKQLYTWVFDKASNHVVNVTNITLDFEAPSITSIIPRNDSYIAADDLIEIEVFEDVSFDSIELDSGQQSSTETQKSVSFDPGWSVEEWKNLSVSLSDAGGNTRDQTFWYYVDDTPPVIDGISEVNNTFVDDKSLTINVSDARSGVGDLLYDDGSGNTSFLSANSFSTDWAGEGDHTVDLYLFDNVGNVKTTFYSYTLDTTNPSSFTNYSWPPQGAVDGWVDRDVPISINATDNFETDRISYCIGDKTCSLDQFSSSGQNVSTTVSCAEGSTCQKYARFRANDSAGNTDSLTTTANISIDKEIDQITFYNPSDGSTTSGTIVLNTTIADDKGVGLDDVNYSVVSRDATTSYQTGDLNASENWDVTWDSSNDISGSQDVTFNVTARDRLGNVREENISFTIDNAATTVSIDQPNGEYVQANFSLDITAQRAGAPLLANHTYNITEKSSGDAINGSVVTGIGQDSHTFDRTIVTSSWSNDGNYTVNSTAWDDNAAPTRGFDESWLYLDRVDPTADLTGINNESWQRETITLDYTATDNEAAASCYWRYKDGSAAWSEQQDLSCGSSSFDFDTSRCTDGLDPDCAIELVAVDKAGNSEVDRIWIKVDNERPSVAFEELVDGSWHNSDIEVNRSDSDNVVPVDQLTCEWRNGSGTWQDVSGSCDGTFTVDISTYCQQEGERTCSIDLRTEDSVGWRGRSSRTVSIDTQKPVIDDIQPDPSRVSIINESADFTVRFHDPTPGSGVQYAYRENGTHTEQLVNDTAFDPGWEENGEYTLTLALNDSADNLVEEEYTYQVDVDSPTFADPRFNVSFDSVYNEYRIYPGQPLRFQVNVSDNVRVGSVVATLNTSSNPGSGENITLSRTAGKLSDGVWSFEYDETSSLGTYNVTALFVEDAVQNINVTKETPAFNVVDYKLDVGLGGRDKIAAGHTDSFDVTVDLNRSLDTPSLRLFIPPAEPGDLKSPLYANTTEFSCTFGGSGCSITPVVQEGDIVALDIVGSGEAEEFDVTGSIRAEAPSSDTVTTWRSRVRGTVRSNDTTILAPDLALTQILCDGSRTCRVNQSSSTNVTVRLANRDNADASGPANRTEVVASNDNRSIQKTTAFGNISSGNASEQNISLVFDEAGNITLDFEATDGLTGAYGDTAQKDVHIRDTELPNVSSVSLDEELIYVNDSVTLEADAADNLGVAAVNVTINNATGDQVNVSLESVSGDDRSGTWSASFNDTQELGFYNLTRAYVEDAYGNMNATDLSQSFEAVEIATKIDTVSDSVTVGETIAVVANVSGNVTEISDVEANISKPRDAFEELTLRSGSGSSDFTADYVNASRSGSYDLNLSVEAGLRVFNVTDDLFSVPFGSPAAEANGGNGTRIIVPDDTNPTLEWDVLPDGGDLTDVNTSLSFDDTSVVDLASGESKREIGNVTYEEDGETVAYDVNVKQQGVTTMNLSVNATNGDQRTFENVTLEVVAEDTETPTIENYEESRDIVNKGRDVVLKANVSDNSVLKNVTIEVRHPENGSGYVEDPVSMERTAVGEYRHVFTNTTEEGHYTYEITAWDIAENNRTVVSTSFDVVDTFDVAVSADRAIFKKNDRGVFDIAVEDVNGDSVDTYNATVVMEKDGSNVTLVSDSFREKFRYRFQRSDPPGETSSTVPAPYKLFVNVSDSQNTGSGVYEFNVTRLLDVSFISPQQGDTVSPGQDFTLQTDIVGPNDERVEGLFYARCEQCPSDFRFLKPAGGSTVEATFEAPQDEESALIRVFASDLEGNSESQSQGPLSAAPAITLDVGNDSSTGSSSGGGGGGGGGGFGLQFDVERASPERASLPSNVSEVNLSVATTASAECRYTTESLDVIRREAMNRFNVTGGQLHWSVVRTEPGTTYSYNVYCEDAGGENGTQEIVFTIASETISSFGLFSPETIPVNGGGIEQGATESVPFSVFNNGTDTLSVTVSSEIADCCASWVMDGEERVSSFELDPGAERSFQLYVDVPLNTVRDRYSVNMVFEEEGRVRERAVRFEVVRGTLIERLNTLKNRSDHIRQTIEEYQQSGIAVEELDERYQALKEDIERAGQAVEEDDREVLATQLDEGGAEAAAIEGRLRALALQNYILENWWKWLVGGLFVYTIFFVVTMIAIPYYRLQSELLDVKNRLESATEARKKAERQYFKRHIDRETFMDIMTERQDEVLELRGERDELEDEMDSLVKDRLTVENYVKAPIRAVRELNRWLEARRASSDSKSE